jgi:hypothetical protein
MSELTMIRTDSESDIDRVYRDAQFFAALYEQNREMENFVNESIIKASGNRQAIQEMYVLNESAFTDKIKAFFTKIKNFFKKIFDKLGATMNALFGEQKKYMEQYANIIMNCKYNGGDVSDIKDHFKGLPRIVDAADNTEQSVIGTNMDKYFNQNIAGNDANHDSFLDLNVFNTYQQIMDAPIPRKMDINDEIKVTAFNEFIKQGYWSNKSSDGFVTKNDNNNTVDIDGTFRAYFDGSEDTITLSGDEVDKNFQVIINATYGGVSYLNKLEKLMNTITKKMDEAEKKMDDYVKAQQDKVRKAVAQQGPKTTDNKDVGISVTDEQIKNAIVGKSYDTNGKATINIGGKSYDIEDTTRKGMDVTVDSAKKNLSTLGIKTEPAKPEEKKSENTKQELKKSEIESAIQNITFKNGVADVQLKGDNFKILKSSAADGTAITVDDVANNAAVRNKFNIIEEAASLYFLLEDPSYSTDSSKSTDSNNSQASSRMRSGGAGSDSAKRVSDNTTAASNMTANTQQASNIQNIDQTDNNVQSKADQLLDADIHNRQGRVNADLQISSSIVRTMFNAFQLTNKDFYSIIQHHVQWYLSNPGQDKESTNKVSRKMDRNIAAGTTMKNPGTPNSNPAPENTSEGSK